MFLCLAPILVPASLVILGSVAIVLMAVWLLAGMFAPMPQYRITGAHELPAIDSPQFLDLIESLTDAKLNQTGILEILSNGPNFYPAELNAIRNANSSVNLEAYIFRKGEIGKLFVGALTERARAGLRVNVVIDAFGSLGASRGLFRPLIEAGGRVSRYNDLAWYRLMRLDNRTHRELLIVDGRIGFIGGAGIADQWYAGTHGRPRWRDTVVRVEGEAVAALQATFAENWLASNGDLLAGNAYFPQIKCAHPATTLVVNSTPTVGGSTRARVLFQLLLASARRSISITTPYFLPDKSLMKELCRAVNRGVKVRILVPGRKSDHIVTRSTSRSAYGRLLEAGAEIYEYQPSMIHAKVMCIDSLWAVVGSTNFDNRSFGLNDEVNLAVCDAAVAMRLESDLASDLDHSRQISLQEWRHRAITERATELLGWVFERQQ
ncbi:MAG TPA: phospholipase D-like domain-containing protein [Terracidiphilus sp.]|nr:phospholipase D-like domain-containing protein [Terracidiphilus sp.]